MRIIYGVSGEGLGHVYEAIEITQYLENKGHTVKILTYGDRPINLLKDFSPTRIEGINFYFNSRGLSFFKTFLKNSIKCTRFYYKNWRNLKSEIKNFQPDIFLTSYEPFTTFLSHLLHKPLISMDNQNELLYIKKPSQVSTFQFKLAQYATKICTYKATYYIIKSFGTIKTKKSNIYFVPQLIQQEIQNLTPTTGENIFIYLNKENPILINLLKSRPETFIAYCNNKHGNDNNIQYRTLNSDYTKSLSECKAIIGTTGFSLVNDAIYLKKPYFGIPLKKQFEQYYNAEFIRKSMIGDFSENPTKIDIDNFIAALPTYKKKLDDINYNPNQQKETLLFLIEKLKFSL